MRRLCERTACTARSRLSPSRNVATMYLSDIDRYLAIPEVFVFRRGPSVMRGLSRNSLDLPHRDHGKEAYEEKEAGKKQPKASKENSNVVARGIEHAPS